MNNRITILPDAVKSKIAAGEVVEGPFSVLKELLENSLDAGARNIDVEIEESGLKRIVVRDDGEGIFREDISLATREHATSKMRCIEDIEGIATFGFRGEALSSIASISDLTVMSRRGGEELGGKLSNARGTPEPGDYAGPAGTTVIVEKLFYNVPARKKFLKSKSAELRRLKDAFLRASLSAPGVSFTLSSEGKRQLVLPAAKDRRERLARVYGEAVCRHLIEEELNDVQAGIHGFLSGPMFHRPSRTLQLLYVNNRPIEYRPLGFLLTRAYESMLRRGEHPVAFLFITLEPSLLDVNVHPAKRELRFFDQNYIHSLVMNLAKKALGGKAHRIDTEIFRGAGAPAGSMKHAADVPEHGEDTGGSASGVGMIEGASLFQGGAAGRVYDGPRSYDGAGEGASLRSVSVVFDTYIVAQDGDGLFLIDYHAAHERIIYDRLITAGTEGDSQGLIFPHAVELTPGECSLVIEHRDVFVRAGFEVEQIGEGAVAVRAVPAAAKGIDIDIFFRDLLDSLDSLKEGAVPDWRKLIAEKAACHGAVRAGGGLSGSDAAMIAAAALSGRHELRCPHGRPYLYRIEKADIEKLFKRS